MKRLALITTALVMLMPSARAQTAVGVGQARSDSAAIAASRATAIGGGQANGGAAQGGSVTINSNTPAVVTSRIENTGTSTVKNVPSVFSPGLAAAGLETCLGSVSGGGSFVGTGFSFGSTIPDPGCAARLDARTLWAMGLKKAAIARLCLGTDIRAAMPEVCAAYLPQPTAYGATYLSTSTEYSGGPIMLVEGRTGKDRLCQDYDAQRHRCKHWDGETHVVKQPAKKLAVSAAPQEDHTK